MVLVTDRDLAWYIVYVVGGLVQSSMRSGMLEFFIPFQNRVISTSYICSYICSFVTLMQLVNKQLMFNYATDRALHFSIHWNTRSLPMGSRNC